MEGADLQAFAGALERALPAVQSKYPGVTLERSRSGWEVIAPASYHVGHEAHFGQVTEQFLRYVARGGASRRGRCPNMLAKYYTTTQALALATR